MVNGILRSFLFGFTLAIAVGPIALLIMTYGIRDGLRPAVAAGVGAALADLIFALIAFLIGALLLNTLAEHARTLRILAGVVLVVIGCWMMWQASRQRGTPGAAARPRDLSRPFVATLLLTLVNPLTIVAFTTFAAQLPLGSPASTTVLYALSLFFGSLIVQMTFAVGGSVLSGLFRDPGRLTLLNSASGAAIVAFGIVGLMNV